MAEVIELEIVVVEPVYLELAEQPVYYIGTSQAGPAGPAGPIGPPGVILEGAKYSLTDAGEFGQISIDDDYVYFCVLTGTAGNAIWKKSPIFKSN